MSEHKEQLAALKALIDQAVESAAEMGRAVGAYYRALCLEGLPPEHAVAVVIAWQTQLLSQRPDDEEAS